MHRPGWSRVREPPDAVGDPESDPEPGFVAVGRDLLELHGLLCADSGCSATVGEFVCYARRMDITAAALG